MEKNFKLSWVFFVIFCYSKCSAGIQVKDLGFYNYFFGNLSSSFSNISVSIHYATIQTAKQ